MDEPGRAPFYDIAPAGKGAGAGGGEPDAEQVSVGAVGGGKDHSPPPVSQQGSPVAVGGAQHIGSSGGYHRYTPRPSLYDGFRGAVVGGFLGVVYEKDETFAVRPVVEQAFRILQAAEHRLQTGVVGQRGGAGANGSQRRPRTEDAHRGGRRQQGGGTSGAVRAGDEQMIAPVQGDGRRLQRSTVQAEGQSPLRSVMEPACAV